MSEETKRKIGDKNRRPMSAETKAKIAAAMRDRKQTLSHRFKNSQSTLGSQHSEDTKLKIAASERATKYRLRRQRLASLAAAAAEAATADLRPAFDARHTGEALQRVFTGATGPHEDGGGSGSSSSSESDDSEEEAALLDMLGLEKAVIEMMSLRRQLGAWMTAQEERHGRKPELTETSETHPYVYGKFVRYVALRELVRRSSLAIGESPAAWQWE